VAGDGNANADSRRVYLAKWTIGRDMVCDPMHIDMVFL